MSQNVEVFQYIKAAQRGEKEARDTLVEKNTGLVWSIVRRFVNRGYELEDLFQIGCIGLIKAIDRFDVTYQVEFSTYAVPMIAGEIKRHIRDNGMVRVSRTLKEHGWKIGKAKEELCMELGRMPNIREIEERTGYTREEIVLAMEANAEVESIDKTMYGADGKEVSISEQVTGTPGTVGNLEKQGNKDIEKEKILDKMLVETLLGELNSRDAKLISLRYFGEKTQSEIAKTLGISQVQVSRLEKKILKKMREKLLEN